MFTVDLLTIMNSGKTVDINEARTSGLCQGINDMIFRQLGGYDRPTATFAAMPGVLHLARALVV